MWPESEESPRPLRTGLTTGCCATACCVAAAHYLLVGTPNDSVNVTLPRGDVVELGIVGNERLSDCTVKASTIKDAGDDPDVTHGATVFVELTLTEQLGVEFKAAAGVGTVTREGLPLAIGEPAINPVPRKMMTDHLESLAELHGYDGGFTVSVGVVNGEKIALKTMNGRLGIVGGLSILGVSGIVRPFSCSAYIASIYQGIDVANANGCEHIAASTGNRSEAAIKAYYQLPDMALIEMGDFVGAVVNHVKKVPVKKLSLCGGFGKISKLAMGKWNLHSQASSIDLGFLATLAEKQGADDALKEKIVASNTSIEALKHCDQQNIDLALAVCEAALLQVRKKISPHIQLEVWVINRQGDMIGRAGDTMV